MKERDHLRAETLAYLETSVNGDHYREHGDTRDVMVELANRVLNARGWKHELSAFDAVLEVVTAAVKGSPTKV